MSDNALLQFEPLDQSARATLAVDLPTRSPHRVNPLLYGKFCEHLGRNIYQGMEAQILCNATFTEVKVGEETTITVTIRNVGKANAENIKVEFYDKTDKKSLGSHEISSIKAGDNETFEFNDWDPKDITEGKHIIKMTLYNQPSGEEVVTEKKVEVVGEEEIWYKEAGAMYIIGGIAGGILILVIIILIFSRTKRPLPEDLKEEIAKAKAEADRERPKTQEPKEKELKKVKKDEIEKLLTKKSLPLPKTQAALPESTKKEKEKPAKAVKIKCPKCDIIQTVTSPKRPLEFECEDCGMKLILKK